MNADRERDERDHLPELESGTDDAGLRAAARAAAHGEADGPHPEADELAAHHEGRLSGPRADQVRAHLAACPECAGLVLDLAAFATLEPPPG
ncbi:MAG TPA: zf-HC2 domain-containing protein, partial [Thermoanaerobaculia bacterium]|nr:zf-HC2 domain-containing protein [Thermoanaerobaculia bacterium]